MIDHIAKKNSKTVLDFMTACALQEYQKEKKTAAQNIEKTVGKSKISEY